MMQSHDHLTTDDAEAFAFAHLAGLAGLLHDSGARDLALLLDGIGDLRHLAQRREAKGGDAALLARRDDTTAYALSQIGDLARLMEAHGLADAALLLRLPAKLQAAADRRRGDSDGAEIYVLPTARKARAPAGEARTAARRVG